MEGQHVSRTTAVLALIFWETTASAFALDTDAGGIKPELAGIRVQPDKHRADILQRCRVRRFRREAVTRTLTRDVGTSRLAQGCTGQVALVEIERFAGSLPSIKAFDPPPS
jgi:hypothetical protein